MTTITQTITEYSGSLPDKSSMTVSEFDAAAEAWVDYQDGLATELNDFADEVNTVGGEMSTNASNAASSASTALAAANFEGSWDDLTGALNVPASVENDGLFWMLLTDLVDVTASEPASTNSDWAVIDGGVSVSDETSGRAITAAEMMAGNIIFDNLGASGAIEFPLPALTGSFKCGFYVAAAQYLKVTAPAGETISYRGESSATAGYVRSNEIGTYFEIIGSATLGYTITGLVGTINVDE